MGDKMGGDENNPQHKFYIYYFSQPISSSVYGATVVAYWAYVEEIRAASTDRMPLEIPQAAAEPAVHNIISISKIEWIYKNLWY